MLRSWHMIAGSIAITALSACTGPDHNGDFDVGNATDATVVDVRRDVGVDVPRDMGTDVRPDVRPDVPVLMDVRDVPVVPDTGGRCVDACSVDTDCQTTCPATAGGSSNCCVFNVCTIVAQPVCPGSMMMGDAGTCSASCGTSAQCAGCSGGRSCCFLGTCMAPPFGFCPDLTGGDGGGDTGVVITDTGTDTGARDVSIDGPISTDAPTATDSISPPVDGGDGAISIDAGGPG